MDVYTWLLFFVCLFDPLSITLPNWCASVCVCVIESFSFAYWLLCCAHIIDSNLIIFVSNFMLPANMKSERMIYLNDASATLEHTCTHNHIMANAQMQALDAIAFVCARICIIHQLFCLYVKRAQHFNMGRASSRSGKSVFTVVEPFHLHIQTFTVVYGSQRNKEIKNQLSLSLLYYFLCVWFAIVCRLLQSQMHLYEILTVGLN